MQIEELVTETLAGSRRALARLLTLVENQREGAELALASLFSHTGHAIIVGVTGAPGVGKSTLVSALAQCYRKDNLSLAIVAVDPTSPYSGGAILGDRVRMRDLAGDPGIFIRSMAARGHLGGLAIATRDVLRVIDAAGFDIILLETVGAGQGEIEVARLAHTVIVVEAPGLGDGVQALKAGILEIADILVLNKADCPGAAAARQVLQTALALGHASPRTGLRGRLLPIEPAQPDGSPWTPPLIETVARSGQGIAELKAAVAAHQQVMMESSGLEYLVRQQIDFELSERLQAALIEKVRRDLPAKLIANLIARIQARELAPQSAVREILSALDIIDEKQR